MEVCHTFGLEDDANNNRCTKEEFAAMKKLADAQEKLGENTE